MKLTNEFPKASTACRRSSCMSSVMSGGSYSNLEGKKIVSIHCIWLDIKRSIECSTPKILVRPVWMVHAFSALISEASESPQYQLNPSWYHPKVFWRQTPYPQAWYQTSVVGPVEICAIHPLPKGYIIKRNIRQYYTIQMRYNIFKGEGNNV